MSTRRFHSKTRTGCRQCKERKIKCDETKPQCNNCIKRNIECSLTALQSTLIVVDSSCGTSSGPNRNDAPTTKANFFPTHKAAPSQVEEMTFARTYSLVGDDNDAFRLMLHYGISTCYSISDLATDPGSLPLRDMIPALAFQQDFLLSGLLAVTSLHLAILHPSPIHTQSAVKYHSEALSLVSPHLTNVSASNAAALFSFSSLIALYAFGFHQIEPATPDAIQSIIEVFTLIRGIRIVVRDGVQWLQGPFASSMLPNPSSPAYLDHGIQTMLSVLSSHVSENAAESGIYVPALEILKQTFLLAAEKPGAKMTVLPLPILVPDEFMQRLEERDPLALVILANWAVVVYWLGGYIWLRGWGKEIIIAVKGAVGPEWDDSLRWAVQEVESKRA